MALTFIPNSEIQPSSSPDKEVFPWMLGSHVLCKEHIYMQVQNITSEI